MGRGPSSFKQRDLTRALKAACKAAGVDVPNKAAHGVRKKVSDRTAEAGATDFELMAMFGWTDPKMAAHYTRGANRRRLAKQGMDKLATSIPSPCYPVRELGRKTK